MRSIQRLGLTALTLTFAAAAYACSGSGSDDLFSPGPSASSSSEDAGGDTIDPVEADGGDGTTNPDAATQDKDAGTPVERDGGDDDNDADDADSGHDDDDDAGNTPIDAGTDAGAPIHMTFFVTSQPPKKGGKMGGLAGADAYCQKVADDAHAAPHTWRAYLSTGGAGNEDAASIDAKSRIGTGPWRNAKGKLIAQSVADLHAPDFRLLPKDALDENGAELALLNRKIYTGTKPDGTADSFNCGNWTSVDGSSTIGFIAISNDVVSSWNSGGSATCSSVGASRLYCFAAD